MRINEALETFGYANGQNLTSLIVTKDWKRLCYTHHPDRGGKNELMALINDARDTLVHWLIEKPQAVFDTEAADYSVFDLFREVLNKIDTIPGIDIEACGSWLWISTTKEHKGQVKAAGCKWSRKKSLWYWRPEGQKKSRRRKEWDIDKIRTTFGSTQYAGNPRTAIA